MGIVAPKTPQLGPRRQASKIAKSLLYARLTTPSTGKDGKPWSAMTLRRGWWPSDTTPR
jgi:hypothetical protein